MLVVAAEESDVLLHVLEAFRAFHIRRDPSGGAQELEAAAGVRVAVNLTVVVHAGYVKAFCGDVLFPFLKLQEGGQNSGAMAINECERTLAENSPSSFFLVAEEFLDFLHHGIVVVGLAQLDLGE